MADVVEETQFVDAATAILQGKRHLLVRDYSSAVNALTQACELLVQKHGDTADELGEPYLLYGRALLFLAREETGVLGTGVPGTEESTIEEEDDEGAEETEKEEEDKTKEPTKTEPEKEKEEEKEKVEEKDEKQTEKAEESQPGPSGSNVDESQPGTSSGSLTNGKGTDANGVEDDDESEDVNKEDDEEDIHNLQVAWEVLELAKLVLLKRGPPGWKHLAEAHRLLGEVAMESGNDQGAITDLNACLDLLHKIEPREPRVIAEIHYQLGLAYSLANDFDASIVQFNSATTLLETRIKELESLTEPPKSDDPFYSVEGEIAELKELLPEIRDKIADMKEYKQEACRAMIEGIKSKVAEGSCSNGAGPSGAGSSGSSTSPSSSKPASNISHLVRKKRKADENEPAASASPCKKPSP